MQRLLTSMVKDPQTSGDTDGAAAASGPSKPTPNLGRGARKTAGQVQRAGRDMVLAAQTVAADTQLAAAKTRRITRDAKAILKRVRASVDAREVAGGLAGLTAGEVMGGAIGGVVGTLFGGPLGAAVGAELGAFTGGMLGMKLGTDAAHDFVAGQEAGNEKPVGGMLEPEVPNNETQKSTGRMGEIVGLASGASIGRIVAGPVGGVIGAVIGEVVGGQIGSDAPKPAGSPQSKPVLAGSDRLNRFGKRVAGESATILVGGAVGSLFGPVGRAAGRRVGFVVARQIEWDKLTEPLPEHQPAPVAALVPPLPDAELAPVDGTATVEAQQDAAT
jgi:hypothetical protein